MLHYEGIVRGPQCFQEQFNLCYYCTITIVEPGINSHTHLSGNIQMHHKIFAWCRFEEDVDIATSETQGLGASFGKLEVVAGWNSTANAIYCPFQSLVLNGENKQALKFAFA